MYSAEAFKPLAPRLAAGKKSHPDCPARCLDGYFFARHFDSSLQD